MKKFIFVPLLLAFVASGHAASYSVATTVPRENTLSRVANEAGATNAQVIQVIVNRELDSIRAQQRKVDIENFGLVAQLGTPAGRAALVATVALPTINPVSDQTHNVAAAPIITLGVVATDPIDGLSLSFSAVNLPPGINISASNGVITGTPITPGIFSVVVRATKIDRLVFIETSFTWTINP